MPQSNALPGPVSLVRPFSVSEPLLWMACFVREIPGLRQARPSVSLNTKAGLQKTMHHNSYSTRIARIIVLIGGPRLSQPLQGQPSVLEGGVTRPNIFPSH